jgi:hypothetical protein
LSGHLYLPRRLARPAYKPKIVFWYSAKLSHIMCPPSPIAPAPNGYQRIECQNAHEVDLWSSRLRAQEKRLDEMTDEERYNFEEPIRAHMIAELEAEYRKAKDPANREFLAVSIRSIKARREKARVDRIERWMACEAKEGVAP